MQFEHKATIDYSNIEYLLREPGVSDTFWQALPRGAPALRLPVSPGGQYDLFLRYKFQPESVTHYTFSVRPFWWQTRTARVIFAVSAAVIVLSFLFYFYSSRKRQLLEKEETARKLAGMELKSIYSQLNPHFIFNSLSSLQSLINKGNIPDANRFLSEFSTLLREALRNNERDSVPLTTEIRIADIYLMLEQLRSGFNYEIRVDPAVNADALEIPPLMLQPLLENAVRHGVAGLGAAGNIVVEFKGAAARLGIVISDNGPGFEPDAQYNGYGLRLTRERIALLNRTSRFRHIRLFFRKSGDNTGAEVHLSFSDIT